MVLKIGHKGAMGYAPENTLRSFRKALELNVDMIELDVYLCKTSELVVIHDDKIEKTTNGKGYIYEKTFEELRKLGAGEGEKIPTLREVLDLVNKRARINIELKGEGTARPVYDIIEEYVKKGWEYTDFLVSSFNQYELKTFRELTSEVEIGALFLGIPIDYAEFAEKLNASWINLNLSFINKEFIDDAHKRGIKVGVWVVNELDEIAKIKSMGIDGIFSDFPDRI